MEKHSIFYVSEKGSARVENNKKEKLNENNQRTSLVRLQFFGNLKTYNHEL